MFSLFLNAFVSISFALAPGDAAPDFKLLNQNAKNVSLSDFKGQKVILEWYNDGCPFVRKHYDSNNMQKTQKYAADKGYTWLTVSSSAPGKQGHLKDVKAALLQLEKEKSVASHLLLDSDGKVGRSYKAKTTPEIFIINESGKISYMGAIDSIASADQSDIQEAINYVTAAIDQISKGQAVTQSKTRPYGCSVKY